MSTKILFYDIETTDLDADFGNMLAFGYKWLGQKRPTVLSILDTNPICTSCGRVDAVDDAKLIKAAHGILSQADMWITWYGKLFDARYLNTRVLDARLKPLPNIPHVDLYWTAKSHLKLSSNRLASVQDFLQLKSKKTPLTKRVWRQGQAGHVKSIKYIVNHCYYDVDVLEEAYTPLKPYVRQHPRVGLWDNCRICDGTVERRGKALTSTKGLQYRFQCQECGAWETRKP